MQVPAAAGQEGGPAVATLFAREAIADLEARLAAGAPARVIDAEVERIGVQYQIASRLTSWVAIDERVAVDPTKPSRAVEIAHALPFGMSAEGLGLRAASPMYAAPMMSMPSASFAYGAAPGGGGASTGAPPPMPGAPARRQPAAPARVGALPPPPRAAAPRAPKPVVGADDADDAFFSDGEVPQAPAPQGPAPKKGRAEEEGGGFFERMRRAFRGEGAAKAEEPPRAPTPTLLKGRVVLRKASELIVEVELPIGLSWEAGQATLHFEGGVIERAQVDWKRSTAPGPVPPGMVLRVTLSHRDEASLGTLGLLQIVFDLPSGVVLVSL